MSRSFKRHLISLGTIIGGVYLVLSIYLYTRQTNFIYLPQRMIISTPKDYGCDYQEVRIEDVRIEDVRIDFRSDVSTPAGDQSLHAWWLPTASSPPAAASLVSGRTLLYFHGNAGNVSANAEHACRLNRIGFSVLIFDYRGYGQSAALPNNNINEKSIYADSEAAWRFLTEKKNIEAHDIVLYGHSLGGAVAIEMAKRHPEASALIAESTFTSLRDVANKDPVFRVFPIALILDQKMESEEKLRSIHMPVLFIHGTADPMVPYAMAERLHAASTAPKQIFLVPGAGHENVAAMAGSEYGKRISDFLKASSPQ